MARVPRLEGGQRRVALYASGRIVGAHPAFFRKALVYAADNRMRPIAADRGRQEAPFDVFEPLGPVTWEAVTTGAGAPPRDDIDSFYVDVLTIYDAFKLAQVAPGVPLAAAKAAWRSLSQSMARSLGPRGFTWRTSSSTASPTCR